MRTLYCNGLVPNRDLTDATALVVEGGTIAWVGRDPDEDRLGAAATVDLGGALVLPAFVDAHVHCTGTGLALTGTALDQVATQLKSLGYTAQGEGEVLVVRAEDAR